MINKLQIMNDESIFFILGAGASIDSGLKTYRGLNGMYNENQYIDITSLLSKKYT